ncbi:hypothetical protein EV363DRAFT_1183666 [Boletus edulis]|nr:hypothetical protein EV363DRAFT_1183666 [Boletus edulis]
MSSPPPLLGPSVLRHLRTSLLVTPIYHLRTDFVPFSSDLVDYLWTSVHQPQSLRISAGVRQGEIWSLTKRLNTRAVKYLMSLVWWPTGLSRKCGCEYVSTQGSAREL